MQVRALRGRVVTPDHIIDDGAVVLSGSHIAWVGSVDQAARAGFGDVVTLASDADGAEAALEDLKALLETDLDA